MKNIAFLMDKAGAWSLSPAFDVTYAYNPAGLWTSRHQMTINGKTDDFTREDFKAVAQVAGLKRGSAEAILSEVMDTVKEWPRYAKTAGVLGAQRDKITPNIEVEFRPPRHPDVAPLTRRSDRTGPRPEDHRIRAPPSADGAPHD